MSRMGYTTGRDAPYFILSIAAMPHAFRSGQRREARGRENEGPVPMSKGEPAELLGEKHARM